MSEGGFIVCNLMPDRIDGAKLRGHTQKPKPWHFDSFSICWHCFCFC